MTISGESSDIQAILLGAAESIVSAHDAPPGVLLETELMGSFFGGTTKNDLGGEMSLKRTDGSTYAHKGKIQSTSGVLSSSTGSMSINIIYPNPEHQLRSGGGAIVIYTYEADSVTLVPRSAIKEIQNKAFVFKVNGNTVEQVEVNATRVNDKEWAILPNDDGSISIHEGDIITSTTNRLKNGDEIEIAQ